jgi:O-antigen/teichoic acid export membrane protein
MSTPHNSDDAFLTAPLSTRVVRGGIWVFALRMTNRGLGLVRIIVLARLLSPEDFGLFGIAVLSISVLETFSNTGFNAAIIQRQENTESYLDTAWTVSVIRGIFLFLCLLFASPYIAEFFNSSQAEMVIRVIAISTLLFGFRNVGLVFFQKELKFNKQFIYELSGTLVELTVAIILAVKLQNMWALIYGNLAANFVRLFLSYLIHQYRPRLKFDMEKFRELFGFGKWVLGSGILIFLITQGDDIFVGKALGVAALGLYQMAYTFSNLPATEICHVISQVTFPAYSKFQDDIPRFRKAYLRVFHFTAFLSIPFSAGIFIMAPDFTRIFLGEKWTLMIPAFQVLAFWGIIRSLGATAGPVFQSVGRPEVLTKLQLLVLALLCVSIYPFSVKWGILGTSLAVILSTFFPNVVATFLVIKVINCRGVDLLKRLCWSLTNTGIMVLSMLAVKNYLIFSMGISEFVLIIILSVFIYFGTSYAFRNLFLDHKEALDFIIQKI